MIKSRPQFNLFDVLILSGFVALITFHPFYRWGELNLFELGLYLPGIEGVLKGMVPYRDFFYLRGPLEIYVPALLMKLFGVQVGVLSTYFYVGTVATLIVGVLLASEVLTSRLVLYLLVPVLVARTFPRVVFTFWGGMRYALGLLAVWCAIKFFKSEKKGWLFAAGVITSLGMLTSVEIGICALAGIGSAMLLQSFLTERKGGSRFRPFLFYAGGVLSVLVPFFIWFAATGALGPYLQITYTVPTRLIQVLGDESAVYDYPKNLGAMLATLVPTNKLFDSVTPAYFYLGLAGYFFYRIRKGKLTAAELGVAAAAGYGLVLYLAAFRKVGGPQFEMALQPEKIAFFFILNLVYLRLLELREGRGDVFFWARALPARLRLGLIYFLLAAFIGSSLGYSMTRYSKRFFAFKAAKKLLAGKAVADLAPLKREEARTLTLRRARGMMVPASQAEDLQAIDRAIAANSAPGETVLMFPELGTYNFLFERPFLGRFPMTTFSWLRSEWFAEWRSAFTSAPPRLAVVSKDPGPSFPKVYFRIAENEAHYNEMLGLIRERYELLTETPTTRIYRLKGR